MDVQTIILACVVLLALGAVSGIGFLLEHRRDGGVDPTVVRHFNQRVRAWWMITSLAAAAFLFGSGITILFFFALSFWALREFITVTPTRQADHRTLFWVFFLFTPLQFVLVWMQQYGLYSVLIPVYGMLFIPARAALSGDHRRFLERTAKIQSGLMVCVYCLSHAPALLTLDFPANATATVIVEEGVATPELKAVPSIDRAANYRLLLFLVVVVQTADISQFLISKASGRNVVAPDISPSRTWEGFLGGAAATALVGALLAGITPYPEMWHAAAMALAAAVMAYAGGLTMSAIKRDRGVTDYGTLVVGHGGVLDRIDSLCFAAPVFFHLTRWLLLATD